MDKTIRYPIPPLVAGLDVDTHHVVEASAGTGKTFIIEHRIVDLIIRGGAELADILVVTFTEKATAELSRRVRSLLSRVARAPESTAAPDEPCWIVDASARRRLEAALVHFDAAPISTIHGFCQRVLADNAFTAGRLFDQSVIFQETAFSEAFRAELRERFAHDPALSPWLDRFLALKAYQEPVVQLEKLLFACMRARGSIEPPFSEQRAIEAAALLHERMAGADLEILFKAMNGQQRNALIKRLHGLSQARGDAPAIVSTVDAVRGSDITSINKWLKAAESTAGSSIAEAAKALFDACPPFKAALAQLFLPHIIERARANKAATGKLDYGDMLTWVWEALCSPAGEKLARDLATQHKFALVDEFQDTDDLQWKIFRRIYLESEVPAYLTVVGDPKQAIYSFRGANLETYRAAVDELGARGATLSRLETCFRSTEALVTALNHLFVEPEPFFTGGVTYHEVVASGQVTALDAAGQPLVPITLLDHRETKGKDICAFLDTFIPKAIERLVRGGATLTTGGETRPLRYRDIFILTRTGAEASDIAGALRQAGVPCSLYLQEGLFQTDEAQEIVDLLTGIADPHDRAKRLKAFATRFVHGKLAALQALRHADSTHPCYRRLLSWKQLADRHQYEELFARILTDSAAIERELLTAPSERAVTNIRHIFDMLLADVARSRCDIWELALRLRTWIAETEQAPPDEHDVLRLEPGDDAVHVMSIHKSKGLEAAVVFLYGGVSQPGRDTVRTLSSAQGRKTYLGRPDESTRDAIRAAVDAENRRLMYVALTRAKAALYLPVPGDEDKSAAYKPLAERLRAHIENLPPGFSRVELAATGEDGASVDLAAALSSWQPAPHLVSEPPNRHRLHSWRRTRRGPDITSYTRLKAHDEYIAALSAFETKDEADLARPEIQLPDTHLPPGAHSGIFLHAVLEHVPFASLEAPSFADWQARADVTGLFESLARRHDISARHLEHAQRLVHAALTTPVTLPDGTVLDGIGRCDRMLREVEVAFPIPGDRERGFVRGIIDLVLTVGDRIYFLDWKSDLLASYAPEAIAAEVERRYRLQLEIYTLAVAKMAGAEHDAAAFEARVGGGLYWFLRGAGDGENGIYSWRPRGADLARISADLAARSYR